MGCFSWMFADKGNEKNLKIGHKGYLLLPNGGELKESCYEGYGEFDGQDAYDLVADWNREYLSQHPEFEIVQCGNYWDEVKQDWIPKAPPKRVDEFVWYPYYADLSLSRKDIVQKVLADPKAPYGNKIYEYRFIGIDIACYDDQNAALPYPIKVVSKKGLKYNEVPASENDPEQGLN